MKRTIMLVLLAVSLVAMLSAQGWGRRDWQQHRPSLPPVETVTVSGSMILAQGMPAIKSGDDTYLVMGISRLVGFIDGLKEGAQVTIEGKSFTSRRDNTLKCLIPSKLNLSVRSYDLALQMENFNFFGPRMQAPTPPPQGSPRQPRVPQMRHHRHW